MALFYLAAGHAITPFATIYRQDAPLAFTKVANPATLPASQVYATVWNRAGEHLLVSGIGFVHVYTHAGDVFTYQGTIAGVPVSTILSLTLSPDGRWLLLGTTGLGPTLSLWQRSGATYVAAGNPPDQPAQGDAVAAWTRDGRYVAATFGAGVLPDADGLRLWRVAGGVFTTVSNAGNPNIYPAGASCQDCSWRGREGRYLAVAGSVAPYIFLYRRVGNTFTKLPDPATVPGVNALSCAYSSGGRLLAVGSNLAPRLTVYSITGETYTALVAPNLPPLPGSAVWRIGFAPDDSSMAWAFNSVQRIAAGSWDAGFNWTLLAFDVGLPGSGRGVAYFPHVPGEAAWHPLIGAHPDR